MKQFESNAIILIKTYNYTGHTEMASWYLFHEPLQEPLIICISFYTTYHKRSACNSYFYNKRPRNNRVHGARSDSLLAGIYIAIRGYKLQWALSTMTSKNKNGGDSCGLLCRQLLKRMYFTTFKVKKSVYISCEAYKVLKVSKHVCLH